MRDVMLRKQKDIWLEPIATNVLAKVHPNVVSFIALLVGLLAAVAVIYQLYWYALILWFLNRILDGLDGLIARIHHKQSDFGGYLDLILDFVIYLAFPVSFVLENPTTSNFLALVALLSSYYINTASWMGLSTLLEKRHLASSNRQTSMEMPTGLIEGGETIVFYSMFCIFSGYVGYLFWLMAALVVITACQRILWAARNLS